MTKTIGYLCHHIPVTVFLPAGTARLSVSGLLITRPCEFNARTLRSQLDVEDALQAMCGDW